LPHGPEKSAAQTSKPLSLRDSGTFLFPNLSSKLEICH